MNTAIEIKKRLETTQSELAEKLGVTRARASQLCMQENLRTDNFERILDVLGYDLVIVKREKEFSGEVPNPLDDVDGAYFLNDTDMDMIRAFASSLVDVHRKRIADEREQERLAEWNEKRRRSVRGDKGNVDGVNTD